MSARRLLPGLDFQMSAAVKCGDVECPSHSASSPGNVIIKCFYNKNNLLKIFKARQCQYKQGQLTLTPSHKDVW